MSGIALPKAGQRLQYDPVTDVPITSGASPLHLQVGGLHYKKLKIQPVEYIHANGLGYFEGTVIKYVSRWKDKGGVEDLEKARHFLDLLIDLESHRDDAQEKNNNNG